MIILDSTKTDVVKIISKTLKAEGFKRHKSSNWIKETDDCYLLINKQGSRWGGEIYLNVGCIVKTLPLQFPDSGLGYDNFHFWERFDGEKLEKCLMWGRRDDMPLDAREPLIVKNIHNTILPWLYSFNSLESIRNYFHQFTFYPHAPRNPKALGLRRPPTYQVIAPLPRTTSVTVLAGGLLPKWRPYTIFELDEETWRHHHLVDTTFQTEEEVVQWLASHDQESLQCFINGKK